MRTKPRWLIVKLHPSGDKPWSGQERCGTGANAQFFVYYVSSGNAVRYGVLLNKNCKPGTYRVYRWPEGGTCAQFPTSMTEKR